MTTVAQPSYRKRIGYQAGLLGGFTLIAAALLVMGDIATRDTIALRKAEDLKASLAEVIPPSIHDNDLLADPLTLEGPDGAPLIVYRAREGLQVTGVAYRIAGVGYAGTIELLLGLDTSGTVLGARVLSHAETPGLGDKMEVSKSDWILGFDGLSLGNPPAERWMVKKDGGDFDQFTGATITPRGILGALRGGLEFFAEHRDTLTASAVVQVDTPDAARAGAPARKP
ncbi:RnfABCDGE type electron transport complex subunit G [Thiocapsa marina]|uniref:Ion-translocating oxidoreductase complex subunit G n=1 Tax=Thiocapsa marina 5811 TaxID=768671 RepID=F9UE31_9GAMM|nr:RnfABCDGE type electron transport complex subunit G [Thiocapsa marina]EGV17588.1 electron transport complex, RnfABCDGE type, G subunit [Thiocapsa marina 5811]